MNDDMAAKRPKPDRTADVSTSDLISAAPSPVIVQPALSSEAAAQAQATRTVADAPALQALLGRFVQRYFPGYGLYTGKLMSADSVRAVATAVYEDGDHEELFLDQAQAALRPQGWTPMHLFDPEEVAAGATDTRHGYTWPPPSLSRNLVVYEPRARRPTESSERAQLLEETIRFEREARRAEREAKAAAKRAKAKAKASVSTLAKGKAAGKGKAQKAPPKKDADPRTPGRTAGGAASAAPTNLNQKGGANGTLRKAAQTSPAGAAFTSAAAVKSAAGPHTPPVATASGAAAAATTAKTAKAPKTATAAIAAKTKTALQSDGARGAPYTVEVGPGRGGSGLANVICSLN